MKNLQWETSKDEMIPVQNLLITVLLQSCLELKASTVLILL